MVPGKISLTDGTAPPTYLAYDYTTGQLDITVPQNFSLTTLSIVATARIDDRVTPARDEYRELRLEMFFKAQSLAWQSTGLRDTFSIGTQKTINLPNLMVSPSNSRLELTYTAPSAPTWFNLDGSRCVIS